MTEPLQSRGRFERSFDVLLAGKTKIPGSAKHRARRHFKVTKFHPSPHKINEVDAKAFTSFIL